MIMEARNFEPPVPGEKDSNGGAHVPLLRQRISFHQEEGFDRKTCLLLGQEVGKNCWPYNEHQGPVVQKVGGKAALSILSKMSA